MGKTAVQERKDVDFGGLTTENIKEFLSAVDSLGYYRELRFRAQVRASNFGRGERVPPTYHQQFTGNLVLTKKGRDFYELCSERREPYTDSLSMQFNGSFLIGPYKTIENWVVGSPTKVIIAPIGNL